MLWDKGVWEPIGDPAKGLEEGHLKFILHGEKLQGGWMLVRKGGRKAEQGERALVLVQRARRVRPAGESITEEMPLSVTTGRTWTRSRRVGPRLGPAGEVPKNRKTAGSQRSSSSTKREPASSEHREQRAGQSKHHKAMLANRGRDCVASKAARASRRATRQAAEVATVELATLVDAAPPGDDWLHEIKFDGYRMLCRVDNGKARFISRNGHDWTTKLPELAQAAGGLPVKPQCSTARWSRSNRTAPPAFRLCRTSFRQAEPASSFITYSIFFT